MSVTRRLLVMGVLAIGLVACRTPGVFFPGSGYSHPSGVHIVAPVNGTQLARGSAALAVDVRLDAGLDPTTLRAFLVTGWPHPTSEVEITKSLVRDAAGATASIPASQLTPGITTVRAEAQRKQSDHQDHGHDNRSTRHDDSHHDGHEDGHYATRPRGHEPDVGLSSFSWEPAVDTAAADHCDVIAARKCLMPFPNDFFTVADSSAATGRRVHFPAASMPSNSSNVPVDPTEWNRNDGFSPGAMIVTFVPNLDLARSGAAPITDIGASLHSDQPIVLLDTDTGERWPIWSELDAQADPPTERALIVRPARNLTEGHHYVVALRNLRDASGALVAPERGFRLYRDQIRTFTPAIEARRGHFDEVFQALGHAGIERKDLTLAWDFTVASEQSLAGRMLHIRDDAFKSLNGAAPAFSVTSVENNVDEHIYRRVTGTFTVPSYLTGDGSPGSRFHYTPGAGPDALPVRNGDVSAGFICNIPRATTADGNDPVHPAHGTVYGHGLLGSNDEVNAGNVRTMADLGNRVFCATKWAGFSEDDIGVAVQTLQELSNFPKVADRTQQGFLNTLFLARLLKDPHGFASDPAFRAGAASTPVLDGTVFYDGNSQGGILGGAVTAVSTEWTRAVLGVPGMNYSTLLQRSTDFSLYQKILNPAYPDELDRIVGFSFLQMLWDRAEADGYAAHMTDNPYPGTPKHQVLLHVAFGDFQVANATADVEARTIGARLLTPALDPGRSPDVVPYFGIQPVPARPWSGSGMVIWDSGNPAPPLGNTAPFEPDYGVDPHENPRRTPAAQLQKAAFLDPAGALVDVCAGPCHTS